MIHPDTEVRFIDSVIGYGVVATKLIPKGTITWVLDAFDQVFEPAQVAAMSELHLAIMRKYSYQDASGRHILCWDNGRFVNHHCEANCLGGGYGFEVAVRDIHPGEQLTDDYGGLNVEEDFPCSCGSPVCRGKVRPDDVLRQADAWDARIADALPLVLGLPQPLWSLVTEHDELEMIVAGLAKPRSSRLQHYPTPGLAYHR